MYDFDYTKPTSLQDAVVAVKSAREGKFLAGGMSLLPTLKHRLSHPSDLVDLARLIHLEGISIQDGAVVVGAMTTHATVGRSTEIAAVIPALAHLAAHIGDPHVRNRGTIGGSIANNDPAADYPAAVLGLGATIKTDRRSIDGDNFFQGMFETALEPDEIVTAVAFPIPERAAYMKFPNPASRFALVGVFVAKGPKGVRVAVTGAGSCVFRQVEMEKALEQNWSPNSVASVVMSSEGLSSDIHASAEYRAHLITVMAKRAVAMSNGNRAIR